MVKFKDIVKKAREVAEKGIEIVKTSMEFERLLSDFDEVAGQAIIDALQGKGYRGMGIREEGGVTVVELAVEDESRVKHIIDRSIMRHYSPKDREKIIQVIPDRVRFRVEYTRKGQPGSSLLRASSAEDVRVSAELYYFVERRGGLFSKVKRDERRELLGGFSFRSSDFVDYENKAIDREKLRGYMEERLRGLGLL